MNKYYFGDNDRIWEVDSSVTFPSNIEELNEAQIAYFLSTPNVSFWQVKNYKKEVDTPFVFDLGKYKEYKIMELDNLSLTTVGGLSPSYKRENAVMSLQLLSLGVNDIEFTQSPIYTKEECINIISDANRIANLCREERYRIFDKIEKAQTKEEVDAAFSSNNYSEII